MTDGQALPPVVRVFRVVSVLEAVSWLILIAATVVKYATNPHQQVAVQVMGPIHGALFIAYVALVLIGVRRSVGWDVRTTAVVLLESIIPFGGFAASRRADLR